MEKNSLPIEKDIVNQRLEYFWSHFKKAKQKFNEGDRFDTIFALIEAGLTQTEYEEFLKINPNGWYDKKTLTIINETILTRGNQGSPCILLHRDPEAIVQRALLHQKFIATMQDNSNSTSSNSV